MRSSPDLDQAYFWEKGVMALLLLLPVTFYHFSVLYTHTRIYRWIIPLCYVAAAIVILVARTGLIASGMQIKSYGYAPVTGPLFFPISVICFSLMILALVNLFKFRKKSFYAEERNRTNYIITGVIISLIATPFDLLPLLGWPLYPGIIIGNIIFCLMVAIAIVKHNLLDIRIVMKRGTAYVLMSTIVAIPYVLIIFILNRLFAQVAPLWAIIIPIIILSILLQPIWSFVQRLVNRAYYRERYTYLQALEEFSRRTHDTTDLNLLSQTLVELVGKALQTSSVVLLLRTGSGDFNLIASTDKGDTRMIFKNHSPIIHWLEYKRGVIEFSDFDNIPQLQAMTKEEKNELVKRNIELVVSLKTKKDELFGLLLLGTKLSQQRYSEEDKQLVSNVTDLVAIELENARLYNIEKTMRTELEKQEARRTEFLHTVAHELKTPLTAVLSSSELLAEESPIPAEIRPKLIDNIFRSALMMDRRVSELMDLAKLQIGDLKIEKQPVDIGSLIGNIATQMLVIFQNKQQIFKMEVHDSLPNVHGDKTKLEQIIYNLLSNANKFSPFESEIILRVKNIDNQVIIEVEDSAEVIPEEDRGKLFDPYFRSEDSDKKDRYPGLGLGLSISKRLVELHRGEIW